MPKREKKHRPLPPPEKFALWGTVIGTILGMIVGLIAEISGGISMMKMVGGGFGGLAFGAIIDGVLYLFRHWKSRMAVNPKTRVEK